MQIEAIRTPIKSYDDRAFLWLPIDSQNFLKVPRQGRVPPTTGSQIFSSTSCANMAFFSAGPDAKHIWIASNLSKGLAQAPGFNFSRYIIIY
jgi:hypothetical protein